MLLLRLLHIRRHHPLKQQDSIDVASLDDLAMSNMRVLLQTVNSETHNTMLYARIAFSVISTQSSDHVQRHLDAFKLESFDTLTRLPQL